MINRDENFKLLIQQNLAEAIEFAVRTEKNTGGASEESLRQTAQDACGELLSSTVDATLEAYRRGLGEVDHAAVTMLFEKLSIHARLLELLALTPAKKVFIEVTTRKGHYYGELRGIEDHDGVQSVKMCPGEHESNEYHPIASITDLEPYEIRG
jgi:hypothetical protein